MAATASLDRPFGLKPPGTVEMLPSPPSGRIAASTAALLAVKLTRSPVAPIGQIDVLLHADAVKGAERKSIEGEDIGAELRQLIPERGQRLGLSRHGRRFAGETQSDADRLVRSDRRLDRRDVLVEACPNVLPAFAGMDVRAIRQMNAPGSWSSLIRRHFRCSSQSIAVRDLLIHLVDFHAAANSAQAASLSVLRPDAPESRQDLSAPRPPSPSHCRSVSYHKTKPSRFRRSATRSSSPAGQTSGQDRIARVERDADRHGLAMADFIARQLLELVRRPMTKVERPRRARFEGIAAEPDLPHVEFGACLDEMVEVRPGKAASSSAWASSQLKNLPSRINATFTASAMPARFSRGGNMSMKAAVVDDRPRAAQRCR